MIEDKELTKLQQLADLALVLATAAKNKRNSYVRRKSIRHRLYKTIGAMNAIVRDHARLPEPAPRTRKAKQVTVTRPAAVPAVTANVIERRSAAKFGIMPTSALGRRY